MSAAPSPGPPHGSGWQRPLFRWTVQFILLFGLWLAFSGRFEPQFLVLGAFSAVLVVFLTSHLFHPHEPERFASLPHDVAWFSRTTLRFLAYLPKLLLDILVANVHVTYLVVHPRLPVSPRLVQFHTALKSEPSQVLLAQSITLTPGTITVDVQDGWFLVHALSPTSSQGLEAGDLQNKVAAVFGQPPTPPEPLRTITRLEEIER